MARDAYEVLGVTPQRDRRRDQAARTAQLARECHPDANPDDPDRGRALQGDQRGLRDACAIPSAAASTTCSAPTARTRARPGTRSTSGQFGLNDLFDAFFSGDVFGGRGPGGARRGPDAETVMELTLAEVVIGVRRTVEMRMPVECDTCDGSGGMPGTHPTRCATCEGAGEVRQVRRSLLGQIVTAGAVPDVRRASAPRSTIPCATCRGDGRVAGQPLDRRRRPGRHRRRSAAAARGPRPGRAARRDRPATSSSRCGSRPNADVRAARRRPVAPAAALDRAGRARRARCSSRRSTGRARSSCSRVRSPARACGSPGSACRRCARGRRGDLVVEVSVRRADQPQPEQAELLAQLARAPRRAGHRAARGPVLAHPVGLQA